MNILAIDVGSYSIKFIEVRPERKNLILVEKTEIILDEVKTHYPAIGNTQDIQKEVIANYVLKKSIDLKIIFQIPNEMLTTRYLEIPGTSKRKTEQIIPFQLDENLPYSLSHAHFSSRLHKKATSFSVISNITQLNHFKDYFSYFENRDIQPSVLTSEISTIQAYIEQIRMNDTCCILDIGHKTTKAYIVQNRQIVSNHTSFVAGQTLNEVISKTYQISHEDAVIYKHENAFMLTDNQFDEVTQDQKEFAQMMKQIFQPLILEIKRWEIGHRVKYGTNLDKIYILGGTTQISGIENFLHFHTGLTVEGLPPLLDFKNDYAIHEKSFYLVKMMALSQKQPSSIINFLTGKFQTASNIFISLHSAVFLLVRSSIIALILILGLLTERFIFLKKQEVQINSKISGLIKTPSLEISPKEQKLFNSKPESVLSSLKNKNKSLTNEADMISKSLSINALKPLVILSKTINSNPKISLEKFSSENKKVSATFIATDPSELIELNNLLKKSGLQHLKINYANGRDNLSVEFTDKE